MFTQTNVRRFSLFAVAAIMLFTLAFAAAPAFANGDTFSVSVYHGINGKSLGLSKDLPVDVMVYKDGSLLATITDFTFKERFEAELPAGEYTIEVVSQEVGPLPSMTIGPVELSEGLDLRIRAKLDSLKTPILKVKVR